MKFTVTCLTRLTKCHVKDCDIYAQIQIRFEDCGYLYLCQAHYNVILNLSKFIEESKQTKS